MGNKVFSANSGLSQVELLELGCHLIEYGYEPVPVVAGLKCPRIYNWQCPNSEPVDSGRFTRQVLYHRDHRSVGFLTRKLPSIDLDMYDDELNAAAQELAEHRLGKTSLQRVGSKGVMLAYRLADDAAPIGKMIIKRTATETEPKTSVLVEIFGAGSQFVGYGIHPVTQRPYRWIVPGCEPITVPYRELPPVTPDMLRALRDDLVALFNAVGIVTETKDCSKADAASADRPATTYNNGVADITSLFIDAVLGRAHKQRSGSEYINIATCPSCGHDDYGAGIRRTADGGWRFHCFHASCEFNDTTGWSPGRPLGERELRLYESLGGRPDDLITEYPESRDTLAEQMKQVEDYWRNFHNQLAHEPPDNIVVPAAFTDYANHE